MTKAQLKKSHDAMARFIRSLCRRSDKVHGADRSPYTEKSYRRALRLLKNAGVHYKPKNKGLI